MVFHGEMPVFLGEAIIAAMFPIIQPEGLKNCSARLMLLEA